MTSPRSPSDRPGRLAGPEPGRRPLVRRAPLPAGGRGRARQRARAPPRAGVAGLRGFAAAGHRPASAPTASAAPAWDAPGAPPDRPHLGSYAGPSRTGRRPDSAARLPGWSAVASSCVSPGSWWRCRSRVTFVEQLADHRRRRPRGGRERDARRLGDSRPRPLPAELPLPDRPAASAPRSTSARPRPSLLLADRSATRSSPASPRARSARSADADRPAARQRSSSARSWGWPPRPSCSSSGGGAGRSYGAGSPLRRTTVALGVFVIAGVIVLSPWDRTSNQSSRTPGSRSRRRSRTSRCPPRRKPLQIEAGLLTSGTRRLVESAVDSYQRSPDFYRNLGGGARALDAAAPAGGRRDRRPAGHRPARQHRHGPGRAGDRRRRAARRSCSTPATTPRPAGRGRRSAWSRWTRPSTTTTTGSSSPATTTTATSSRTGEEARLHHARRQGRRRAGRHPAARRQRPAQQRAGHLARREGHLLRGAGAAPRRPGLRARRGRRPDQHAARARREQRPRGSRRGLRRPGAGRPPPRAGRAPTATTGENGKIGYSYTNGTTGGAAYAIAIGSKLRRDAEVTLVTYADGVPVGLQPVTVTTIGAFSVGDYVPLTPTGPADEPSPSESPSSPSSSPSD